MAARIVAISESVRSVGKLMVPAPRPAMTRALAGFATGSMTETFACISAGIRPARRSASNTERTPMSSMSTLRMP